MENTERFGLENFEAVWQRVQGGELNGATAKRERTADALQTLLDEKYRQMRLLSALSRQLQGAARQTLQQLFAEEQKQYRRLEMERFMQTGQRHRAPQGGAAFADRLTGLRMAWQREKDFSSFPTEQSAFLPDGMLQAMAEEDEKHAAQLYALIRKIMLG